MKIGWMCGGDGWAFEHVTEALSEEMLEYECVKNKCGDGMVFFVPDQLIKTSENILRKSIIRLGGNRWWSG